jgi:hypothetical protein
MKAVAGLIVLGIVVALAIGSCSDSNRADATVYGFLEDLRAGHDGQRYWLVPSLSNKLFNVSETEFVNAQGWERKTDGKVAGRFVRYRVTSTNQAGSPVKLLWDFCTVLTKSDEYKIVDMSQADDAHVESCKRNVATFMPTP